MIYYLSCANNFRRSTAIGKTSIISEKELIQRLREKDVKAFEYLYDNYSSAVYGIILKIVRSEDFAEELLNDCFLRIWDKIGDYDSSKGRLFTWILNISRNIALDKLRSKEYKIKIKTDDVSDNVLISDTHYSDANKPEFIGVKEILDKLPVEQKKLIDMMYFQGYSQSEIAEELSMPLGTVKTRVRAAMITLRQLF
jgi:RNA polymerase sigma factor (sigma-70 family)